MNRLLIVMSLLCGSWFAGTVHAVTLSPNDVAAHMADPAHVSVMLHATALFDDNQFDDLDDYLDAQPMLLKEEALTVLARRALDFSLMTPEKERFLVTISREQPKFLVKSQGAGYWVTMPAFNYAGEAKWVLNRWQIKLLQNEVVRLLGYNQFSLSHWLSFSADDYTLRREALVALIPTLSSQEVQELVKLYLDDSNMVWSPDNAVLAALATESGDVALYDLLWLRRTDSYSLTVLQKLETSPVTEKQIQLMIAATVNPVLAETAIRQLSSLHTLPDSVKAFLRKQIADRRQGEAVVIMLAKRGHSHWLRELEKTTSGVTRRNIENGLDAVQG